MPKRIYTVLFVLCICAYYTPIAPKLVKKTFRKFAPNRYNSNSELETATPSYVPNSGNNDRFSARSATRCSQNCTWDTFTPNPLFRLSVPYRSPFAIDDTDRLKNHSLACSPNLFGYSIEAGEAVFPPYQYPSCASLLTGKKAVVQIDWEKRVFTVECPRGGTGKYMLEPEGLISNGQYYFHELDWKVKTYPGHPVSLGLSEYVYASCDDHFTAAKYFPFRNDTAYARAQSLMSSRGLKHKPVSVLFISIDSFSRRHFFRKLEKTLQKLNDINSEDGGYSVFDFKLHNVLGATSTENMVPMFSNLTFTEVLNPPFRDLLGPGSLWNIFKANGFVTLMGYENCDYHFPSALGKVVEVDHFVRNFYCAASKHLNLKMSKEGRVQRCIGEHMSHYYLLNYTKAFAEEYKEVNQFGYLHLNAAHEETGQHAVTLDSDLEWFLSTYLRQVQSTHDVVLFLQGDHGMRYGNWYKDIEAYQENKLPALFLIASDRLLERLPASYDVLWHNSERLMSKRDLRATLLGLARVAYGEEYPVHEEPYLSRDYNLLSEKIPDYRTCRKLQIPPWYCSCLDLKEIEPDVFLSNSDPSLNTLLTTISKEAIHLINSEVFSPNKIPQGLCRKLTFRSVLKAYGLNLGTKMEQIQLEFGVLENDEARFEVYAIVGTENGSHFMRLERERAPLTPLTYRGHQTKLRVSEPSR